MEGYAEAFSHPRLLEPYLTYYAIDGNTKAVSAQRYTRGDVWALACRAVTILQECGLTRGDAATHYHHSSPDP